MEVDHILNGLLKKDPKAQKLLYDTYASMLMGVARRYVDQIVDAEDILLRAFLKIFDKIGQFQQSGAFEAWMRKIVVNEALMFLRKRKNLTVDLSEIPNVADMALSVEDKLAFEDLLQILDDLPVGYRTIFNLYVIEGYKHREIAELLGISINTSKSQLILAKRKLRTMLNGRYNLTALRYG